jgi:hypothetical protein
LQEIAGDVHKPRQRVSSTKALAAAFFSAIFTTTRKVAKHLPIPATFIPPR